MYGEDGGAQEFGGKQQQKVAGLKPVVPLHQQVP